MTLFAISIFLFGIFVGGGVIAGFSGENYSKKKMMKAIIYYGLFLILYFFLLKAAGKNLPDDIILFFVLHFLGSIIGYPFYCPPKYSMLTILENFIRDNPNLSNKKVFYYKTGKILSIKEIVDFIKSGTYKAHSLYSDFIFYEKFDDFVTNMLKKLKKTKKSGRYIDVMEA